jgi:hypothetical protein
MAGMAIPMGTFIPSMVIGGVLGRFAGESLGEVAVAPAGVYALIGSAAFLSGFSHMTMGVAGLLAEAAGEIHLVAPLLVVSIVARTVARLLAHHGYDSRLISRKGVPFLEAEIPEELDASGLTAADVCEALPQGAQLPLKASLKAVKRALRDREVSYFPIIGPGHVCVGLTTRGRLKAAVQSIALSKATDSQAMVMGRQLVRSSSSSLQLIRSESSSSLRGQSKTSGCVSDVQTEAKYKNLINRMFQKKKSFEHADDDLEDDDDSLPLHRIMDPAPFMLMEHMPVPRFYALFCQGGANVACVVSSTGKFRGILSRRSLIAAAAGRRQPTVAQSYEWAVSQFVGYPVAPSSPVLRRINSSESADSYGRDDDSDTDASSTIGSEVSGMTHTPSNSTCATPLGTPRRFISPGSTCPGSSAGSSSRSTTVSSAAGPTTMAAAPNSVVHEIVVKLSKGELQTQLTTAWARLAEGERQENDLKEAIRAYEDQLRTAGLPYERSGTKSKESPVPVVFQSDYRADEDEGDDSSCNETCGSSASSPTRTRQVSAGPDLQ